MTFEKLTKTGLKKVFLINEEDVKFEKWQLLGRFILPSKNKGNVKDVRGLDMCIYYYDETHCYVKTHCSKYLLDKEIDMSMGEIVEYQYFFTHIFDVDDYVIE